MKTRACLIVVLSLFIGQPAVMQATAKKEVPVNQTPITARKALKKRGAIIANDKGALSLLREAYLAMRRADHDYHGHRARAMEQTAAAARVLGEELKGGGKAGEKQGESDAQLHAAEGLLQRAQAELAGTAARHVATALKQISIALSVH